MRYEEELQKAIRAAHTTEIPVHVGVCQAQVGTGRHLAPNDWLPE